MIFGNQQIDNVQDATIEIIYEGLYSDRNVCGENCLIIVEQDLKTYSKVCKNNLLIKITSNKLFSVNWIPVMERYSASSPLQKQRNCVDIKYLKIIQYVTDQSLFMQKKKQEEEPAFKSQNSLPVAVEKSNDFKIQNISDITQNKHTLKVFRTSSNQRSKSILENRRSQSIQKQLYLFPDLFGIDGNKFRNFSSGIKTKIDKSLSRRQQLRSQEGMNNNDFTLPMIENNLSKQFYKLDVLNPNTICSVPTSSNNQKGRNLKKKREKSSEMKILKNSYDCIEFETPRQSSNKRIQLPKLRDQISSNTSSIQNSINSPLKDHFNFTKEEKSRASSEEKCKYRKETITPSLIPNSNPSLHSPSQAQKMIGLSKQKRFISVQNRVLRYPFHAKMLGENCTTQKRSILL